MLFPGTSRLILAAAVLVAAGCDKKMDDAKPAAMGAMNAASPMGTAEYAIVVKSTWTKANHPFEYPEPGVLTGPHFSGIIGGSHNAKYSLFAEGTLPTPGLEHLSEEGKHTPLDAEIQAAIAAGSVGMMVESGPLKDFADSIVTTVKVDDAHPMVSFVMMVAPSPDWFSGAASVNLMENGAWAASRTLVLNAWDSGGDDGTTYKAADKDNNPKKPTSKAMTRHFVTDGKVVPVATVTFTKK